MRKTIFITGATDGIGLATAKMFAAQGHNLLIHGRNSDKLKDTKAQLATIKNVGTVQTYLADLSIVSEVKALANTVKSEQNNIDVLINNAGVFKVPNPITQDGLDVRFIVNTIAPYILTQELVPLLRETSGNNSRVINLSSAAQAPVDIDALLGNKQLSDMEAYSQSKLAITMWTERFAEQYKDNGPIFFAVNPGSLLASKMVKEGFGVAGHDITIGATILMRLSLEEALAEFSGQYFDNDSGKFSLPHPDGLHLPKSEKIIEVIENMLAEI